MVNQQNRQIQLVGKTLDLSYFLVVACVRSIVSRLADDLKGVDDNKRKVGVFFFEVHQLRNQPVIQRIGFKGQKKISRAFNESRVGSECEVLVEGQEENGLYYGRSQWEAPETDGKVYIKLADGLEPGQFVRVRITDAQDYDVTGVPV